MSSDVSDSVVQHLRHWWPPLRRMLLVIGVVVCLFVIVSFTL